LGESTPVKRKKMKSLVSDYKKEGAPQKRTTREKKGAPPATFKRGVKLSV